MRKTLKNQRCTRRARRLRIPTVVVVLAIVALGAVTVMSRQNLDKPSGKPKLQVSNNVKDLDATIAVQDDKDKLADGLKKMINQSTEGLAEVRHSDGSISITLDDRFQNVTVVKDRDGRLSQSCVDNPEAAGAFFNIDPKLIDNKSRALVTR